MNIYLFLTVFAVSIVHTIAYCEQSRETLQMGDKVGCLCEVNAKDGEISRFCITEYVYGEEEIFNTTLCRFTIHPAVLRYLAHIHLLNM